MTTNKMVSIGCIIDTDIVIDYLRNEEYAPGMLRQWWLRGYIGISTLTYFEVYSGMRQTDQEFTNAFLYSLEAVVADAKICQKAGVITQQLRSRGITIGVADLIIAATALELGVPLITNNIKHFSVPGLTIVHGKKGDFYIKERRHRYSARKSKLIAER